MFSTWYLIGTALVFGLSAVGAFVWLAKNGYFSDVEEIKYSMFRNEDDERRGDDWN